MTELAPSQGSTSAVPPPGLVAGEAPPPNPILARARDRAPASKPGYAGNVTPQEAWELASSHAAVRAGAIRSESTKRHFTLREMNRCLLIFPFLYIEFR